METGMLPLYLARIEDLGRGDFVKVECSACHHVTLLTPDFLLRLGLSPHVKVLDLKQRVRCRGFGARGRAVVSIKWRRVSRCIPAAVRWRWRRCGDELVPLAGTGKPLRLQRNPS